MMVYGIQEIDGFGILMSLWYVYNSDGQVDFSRSDIFNEDYRHLVGVAREFGANGDFYGSFRSGELEFGQVLFEFGNNCSKSLSNRINGFVKTIISGNRNFKVIGGQIEELLH